MLNPIFAFIGKLAISAVVTASVAWGVSFSVADWVLTKQKGLLISRFDSIDRQLQFVRNDLKIHDEKPLNFEEVKDNRIIAELQEQLDLLWTSHKVLCQRVLKVVSLEDDIKVNCAPRP